MRRRQRLGQRRVQPFALIAQFQHVAEDGNAAALRADVGLAEQRDGGCHRRRIGVVAFVDQQSGSARNFQCHAGTAADRRAQLIERQRGQRQIGAGQRRRRQHGERIEHQMLAGRP